MTASRKILLAAAALCLSLRAQSPASRVGVDEAFFKQDPKVVMRACTAEARRLAKRDLHVIAECGDVLLTLGDRAQAEALFDELPRRSPRADGETYRLVGRAWLRHGFQAEALKAYDQMLDTPSNLSWDARKNYLKRAAIDLVQAGLTDRALSMVEASYAEDRGDAQNCFEIGAAALTVGQTDLAVRCFQRAFKAEPRDVDPWLSAAGALGDQMLRATPHP